MIVGGSSHTDLLILGRAGYLQDGPKNQVHVGARYNFIKNWVNKNHKWLHWYLIRLGAYLVLGGSSQISKWLVNPRLVQLTAQRSKSRCVEVRFLMRRSLPWQTWPKRCWSKGAQKRKTLMGKLLFSNDGIGNAPRILEPNPAKNGLSFFCGNRCLRFRGHSTGPTFFFFGGGGWSKVDAEMLL